ncbi:MAG: 1-deoxy-D-xylulose-5-phosphate synthase, partial [Clostridia bacterium]|nr:1-deoxy-D-xylulose-5-phosphate synthase [Clostridia bacterium]
NGGHIASSLGATEIIIALHRVLNCPFDKIIFDVGHQAYAHKLLTGRYKDFNTLRTANGISGFPKINESVYDFNDAGHASDSLSFAMGYAFARDADEQQNVVAVVIGDASFAGGMIFEAINHLGNEKTKLIIILNDNGMSISKNRGSFARMLAQSRMSKNYINARDFVNTKMQSRGKLTSFLMDKGNLAKNSFKQFVLPQGMLFEQLGLTYAGPFDGHNISTLQAMIKEAKKIDGPVLIHAVTKKGKGYKPAEKHPDTFHGVSGFDIKTGSTSTDKHKITWTDVFGSQICKIAKKHDDVYAFTAAMTDGTGLKKFAKKFPERFYDPGIAEAHAVALAAGLAHNNKVPYVAIYSSFLQRAFDQIIINTSLSNAHVVFCIDRAGLVGADGPTHHGAFDISYLRLIPNMKIIAPSDERSLRDALTYAYSEKGPVAIRYARGKIAHLNEYLDKKLAPVNFVHDQAHGRILLEDNTAQICILALGNMVEIALQTAKILLAEGITVSVFDAIFAKPLDKELLKATLDYKLLVTLEDNNVEGGFGSAVAQCLCTSSHHPKIINLGLPDSFVGGGAIDALRKSIGLDAKSIAENLKKQFQKL